MGEKISTIVLNVDLECRRCYKKIRRVLCRIQDKMEIKTISFDEKSNTVTISGPFDPEEVCNKLRCHAGRVIKDMNIKGKESKAGGGDKTAAAAKPAETKDAGKGEKKAEGGKADNKEGNKAEKGGKADKPAEKKEASKDDKPGKETPKDANKAEKKVTFEGDAAPPADAKVIPKADLGPLLKKMLEAKAGGPEPPRGEPIAPPAPAAQGVAVPSIWPAPASSLAGYSYNPSYDPSSYYGGGGYGGYGACGCGYADGYCRCGKPAAAAPAGGYYGVPVYDNQGWYYGARQPYYPQQQQPCCEDPNAAGCSVM